jgi:hypothetical protein
LRKSFDTSHFLKKVKKVSALTPEDFLEKLEADGFKLREENGRLFIGPNSRLADLDRGSVDRLREGLLALLRDRAARLAKHPLCPQGHQLDAKARCWK